MNDGFDILIVDDQIASALALRFPKDRVTQANDSASAIAALEQRAFHVVLLDMQMPNVHQVQTDIAGLDVLNWVDRHRPGLSVVVLTGFGTPTNVIESAEFGARAYASKQIEPLAIVDLVRRVAQQSSNRQERLRQQMHEDVANARRRQRAMFPSQIAVERFPPLTIAGRNVRTAMASGDIFDIIEVRERNTVAFYLLDVTHHGLGAALIGARLSGIFRCGVRRGWSLPEIHDQLDRSIRELANPEISAEGVIGCLDIRANRLDIIRSVAQQPCKRTTATTDWVTLNHDLTGVGLGRSEIFSEVASYPATESIPFGPGDSIIFFTDGVADVPFPARLDLVRRCHKQASFANAQELADLILHGVLVTSDNGYGDAEQSGIIFEIDDDATVLALAW